MGDIWTDKMSAYLGTVRGLILLGISFSDLHSNAGSQLHKRIIVTPPGQQDRKINIDEKTSEGIVKSIQGPGLSWRHFYGYQAVTGFFSLQLLCNLFSSALFQHWAPWFTPNNCYQKLFSYLFLVSLLSPFFSFQIGLGTRLICFILSKVYSFFEDQLSSSNEIITEAGILQCVYNLAATEVAFSNPKDTFLIRHMLVNISSIWNLIVINDWNSQLITVSFPGSIPAGPTTFACVMRSPSFPSFHSICRLQILMAQKFGIYHQY